jgi:hypothetical protein
MILSGFGWRYVTPLGDMRPKCSGVKRIGRWAGCRDFINPADRPVN